VASILFTNRLLALLAARKNGPRLAVREAGGHALREVHPGVQIMTSPSLFRRSVSQKRRASKLICRHFALGSGSASNSRRACTHTRGSSGTRNDCVRAHLSVNVKNRLKWELEVDVDVEEEVGQDSNVGRSVFPSDTFCCWTSAPPLPPTARFPQLENSFSFPGRECNLAITIAHSFSEKARKARKALSSEGRE